MGKVINKGSWTADDYKKRNAWVISYGQPLARGSAAHKEAIAKA
jgi:hypothetical protein